MKLRKLNDIQEDLQNAKIDLINQQIKIVSLQLEENKKLLKTKKMKTTIDKEFFEKWKNENVVMWCKKEEYAKEFCRLMDEQGLTWYEGTSYLNEEVWDLYEGKTAYEFNSGEYASKEFYEEEFYEEDVYTILDFEDYVIKKKMTKKELVELIIDNFADEYGYLDLSELDFSDFCGDVFINAMKVNGSLY